MDFLPTTDEAAAKSLNSAFRHLLREYSGKDEQDLVEHVKMVRNRCSFTKSPYFAEYRFTDISMRRHDLYPEVVLRIKDDHNLLLDLGCGLGQNLRQLILDGAPMQGIQGHDINPALVELGTDLFNDGDRYRVVTSQGDFLSPTMPTGLREGKFDIIFAGFFFDRIIDSEMRRTAMRRTLRMLKPRSRSLLLGWQIGRLGENTNKVVNVDGESVVAYSQAGFERLVIDAATSVGRNYQLDISLQTNTALHAGATLHSETTPGLVNQICLMRFAFYFL